MTDGLPSSVDVLSANRRSIIRWDSTIHVSGLPTIRPVIANAPVAVNGLTSCRKSKCITRT